MKIKTLIRFSDLKEKTIREVGEEFEATKERVSELLALSISPIVEVIESDADKKIETEQQEEIKEDAAEEVELKSEQQDVVKEDSSEEIEQKPIKSKK